MSGLNDLHVTPSYLEKLATKQDEAATEAAGAATVHGGVGTNCWVSHGVMSGPSNSAVSTVETTRTTVGNALAKACSDLKGKLLTAKQMYAAVDDELAGNLDKQVVPK
jgi:hypothetical protein